MKDARKRPSRYVFSVAIFLLTLCSAVVAQLNSPCSQPEYRAFDFWAGDWEVFEVDILKKVADARVVLILDGCVLHENFRQADGMNGQSFTIYDGTRHIWHQSWVTNRGKLLEIEGKFANGKIALSGTDQTGALVRGVWRPDNGGVRETTVTSIDGGQTWRPWFDLVFRPPNNAVPSSSSETVAAVIKDLDTRYQKAVEANDAATMEPARLTRKLTCWQRREAGEFTMTAKMMTVRPCASGAIQRFSPQS